MGEFVVEKMRRGIIRPELYVDNPDELVLGMLAVLIGCTVWLILATFFGLPVSTTHSIVGALLGFTIVAKGADSVNWWEISKIAFSWVTSPILAGTVSVTLYVAVRHIILRRDNSLRAGMWFLPLFYGFTLGALVFFVIFKGSPGLGLNKLPLWVMVLAVAAVAFSAAGVVWFVGLPYMWLHINAHFDERGERLRESEAGGGLGWEGVGSRLVLALQFRLAELRARLSGGRSEENEQMYAHAHEFGKLVDESAPILGSDKSGDSAADSHSKSDDASLASGDVTWSEKFDPRTEELFSFLQVLTACVGGFSHGANDVANSIGPFAVIIAIYMYDDTLQRTNAAWWILLIGGAGIVIGLATWGYRVMATIGHKVTKLTPTRGFTIEFGAAMTVLLASRLQIPVSTTHCVVGSVAFVGLTDGVKAVNTKLVATIFASWIITLPFTGALTAAVFAVLHAIF
eukprot:TRINITY_DN6080_c0_g1_i3.p1 TRINITY_DN6080_c0_g1~~TRINITY_DN6080_c0_g1_i3.p1  ORF type:complete len:457 (-),score=54.66 TRINITY_DN6080_c0_g1_i3:53-1423(-)